MGGVGEEMPTIFGEGHLFSAEEGFLLGLNEDLRMARSHQKLSMNYSAVSSQKKVRLTPTKVRGDGPEKDLFFYGEVASVLSTSPDGGNPTIKRVEKPPSRRRYFRQLRI
jgi:hypothetical protein